MPDQPWFHEGLRFTCTQCGDCCSGAPGYVWVRQEDIERLAEWLKMDVDTFEKRYTRKVGIRRSLVEFPDGDCVFFDSQKRKCSVYEARPMQCRTWPFWESNIKSEKAWQRTCAACPGSGQGTLVPVEKVLEQSAAMRL
jgi:Fe-S-cluster containining protein